MARVTPENLKRSLNNIYVEFTEKLKIVNTKAVHANREALDKFSEDTEGNPLYNGLPIKGEGGGTTQISAEPNNSIVTKEDGIYVKRSVDTSTIEW